MKALVLLISVLVLGLAACDLIPFPPDSPPSSSRCTMAAGLSCADFALEDGQLTLSLQNGMGQSMDIESVTLEERGLDGFGCVENDIGVVANGATVEIVFDESCAFSHDTWYDLEVRYSLVESLSNLRAKGELYIVP